MAIPKGLVSREMLTQMSGIKSSRTSLTPTNSSGTFVPSGNNRVIFQIPSYENSFINTKRSYIHFKLQATGTNAADAILTPGAPVFRRLLLKNSRGQVLSDIDNCDVLCRLMSNKEPEAELKGKSSVSFDTRADGGGLDRQEDFSTGKTVVHDLLDGLLGRSQEYLIPVSSLVASAGPGAFQLELWLNDPAKVFCASKGSGTVISYSMSDVAYDLELVELSPELMTDINTEISGGASIPIPYRSVHSYTNQVASGSSYKAQITDMSHDVESVFSVIRKQSQGDSISVGVSTDDKSRSSALDPYRFMGGRFSLGADNVKGASDTIVTKYSYRYGSHYYPLSPANLDVDSTLALENVISNFELDQKPPFMAEKVQTSTKKVPRFETDTFVLASNFKTTSDANIRNGLNSSATGAPIELNLTFSAGVTNLTIDTFVMSTQTLYIKMNGAGSLIKD